MREITATNYLLFESDLIMRKIPCHVYASPAGFLDLLWGLAMGGTLTPWMLKIYLGREVIWEEGIVGPNFSSN
jgi:hypothetical protein